MVANKEAAIGWKIAKSGNISWAKSFCPRSSYSIFSLHCQPVRVTRESLQTNHHSEEKSVKSEIVSRTFALVIARFCNYV